MTLSCVDIGTEPCMTSGSSYTYNISYCWLYASIVGLVFSGDLLT